MADEGRQDHVTFDDLEKILLLLQGDQDLNSQEIKEMLRGVLFHLTGLHVANSQLIKSLYTWLQEPNYRRQTLLQDALDDLEQIQDGLPEGKFHPMLVKSYQQQLQEFRDLYDQLSDASSSDPPESTA